MNYHKGDHMKTTKSVIKMFVWVIALSLAVSFGAMARDVQTGDTSQKFSKEELAQMLAPIALYPDTLLAQVLMASTYPLEVVEAERWVKKNPDLKGDQLDAALKEKDWDVSVKSMAHFPDVLNQMSENLDQTSRLGDAFLAQQEDVMDSVQELRARAKAEGNLETTKEQKVVVQEKTIIVESADPQIIYVPTYSPTVVYGTWWYPAYPPYPAWYPGSRLLAFGSGVVVGAALGRWCGFGWRNHSVNVNINRTANINRNVYQKGSHSGKNSWKHNPKHRRGVAYRDGATGKRYGQSPSRSKQARRDARGYGKGGKSQGQRPGSLDRSRPKGQGSGTFDRSTTKRTPSASRDRGGSRQSRSSAFGGMNDRPSSSMSSNRGRSSRSPAQSRGGGRSGGHRGGGGRRGR